MNRAEAPARAFLLGLPPFVATTPAQPPHLQAMCSMSGECRAASILASSPAREGSWAASAAGRRRKLEKA